MLAAHGEGDCFAKNARNDDLTPLLEGAPTRLAAHGEGDCFAKNARNDDLTPCWRARQQGWRRMVKEIASQRTLATTI